MKTLRDLLDIPLPQLGSLLKNFLAAANDELSEVEMVEKPDQEDSTEDVVSVKIAEDLKIVLEYHKAIAEKYQITEADSLLKHLVTQLAKERNLDIDADLDEEQEITVGDGLEDEIKEALAISSEKRELLKLSKVDRAESVALKTISDNAELVKEVLCDGSRELVEKLTDKAIENAHGVVSDTDVKFALRSVLHKEAAEGRLSEHISSK